MHRSRAWRRTLLVVAGFATFAFRGLAEQVAVPPELQALFISKLLPYDRNFTARAANEADVLIVVKAKDAGSTAAGAAMKSALSRVDRIGGLPHRETIVSYDGAQSLAQRCRREHVSVLYVTPGLDDDIEALAAALSGVDVLSVSVTSDYVPRGVVLGFELASGKPKLVLNLTQAKKQNVAFMADAVKLMRVYR
jgi:hypothetical protein